MGDTGHTITLYSPQSEAVIRVLERDGVCYSKPEYVAEKYGESAPIFLTVYRWYAARAARLVPPPPGAQFPYWAFADPADVDLSGGGRVLRLRVPVEEAVLFDRDDWTRLLQLRYLGRTEEETAQFQTQLALRGLDGTKVMLSQFYPEWKQAILDSWEGLFRHHHRLCRGDRTGVGGRPGGALVPADPVAGGRLTTEQKQRRGSFFPRRCMFGWI